MSDIFNDAGVAPADNPSRVLSNIYQVPTGGALNSREFNATINRLAGDAAAASKKAEDVKLSLEQARSSFGQAASWRQASVEQLLALRLRDRIAEQKLNLTDVNSVATYRQDFHLLGNLAFGLESTISPGTWLNYPVARRCRVESDMGQVVPPYTNVVSAFRVGHSFDTMKTMATDALVTLTETSEEPAQQVTQNNKKYIYNGEPDRPWIVRAAYPLASSISEVSFDVVIQVPQAYIQEANLLRIVTAPEGHVDIVDIQYSEDTDTPDTSISGAATNEATSRIIRFDVVPMASLKVSLRCRRFIEEAGYKVFYLGIQDLDLQLVEYDSTFDQTTSGEGSNNGFFDVIDIPTATGLLDGNYEFLTINGVRTSSEYSTSINASGTDNGIRVMIATDSDLTNFVWDSVGSLATGVDPASSPVDVSAHATDKLYVVVELDTDQGTPILENLEIDYRIAVA